MSSVPKFMLQSFAIGMFWGWAMLAAVFFSDPWGLGALVSESKDKYTIALLGALVAGGTLGVCAMATGLEFLASDKE